MKHTFAMILLSGGLIACTQADRVEPEPTPAGEAPIVAVDAYEADGWAMLSLPELAASLAAGEVTSEELTGVYLDRIAAVDRAGPMLQSVLTLNPDALDDARAADALKASGEALGPLHGVPILLKDNIESADDMPTTAGSLALRDNVTGRDSPLVAGLRANGAIILGKTNLSQWANFRSNDSMSGWSALGGQVRNPHMLDRNPCGSSSGSGVAVSAALAAGAVGTETNGSIICPSTINGVVGLKPTVGLVSQQYIVPISSSQDTAGPMTQTVTGAALMLSAMATGEAKVDYLSGLSEDALQGKRVGVLRFAEGSHSGIKARFDEALVALEGEGASLVEVEGFNLGVENYGAKSLSVLEHEFKATLDDYLADAAPEVEVRSLAELIAFNEANAETEMALFDQSLFVESQAKGGLDDADYIAARDEIQRATGRQGISRLMKAHNVDVLVSPSGPLAPRVDPINGDVWPSWAGAGWIAAVSGYPHLTVPMGEVDGLPVGLSFMARANEDAAILSYGYAFEQATGLLVTPRYLSDAEERQNIAKAMKRMDRE